MPGVVFAARLHGRYELDEATAAGLLAELDAIAAADTGVGLAAAERASRIRRFDIGPISVDQRTAEDTALARALDHLFRRNDFLPHDAERLRAYLAGTAHEEHLTYRLRDHESADVGEFVSISGPYRPGDRLVLGRYSDWTVADADDGVLILAPAAARLERER